jgi:indole-3-glycerol phosphate synthase / phosphoribosylanthranilate isomerase
MTMPESFLERIVAATRDELAERTARVPLDELRARAASAPAPRAFATALRPVPGGSARLIAEVKRASPSKGLLAETFDPVAQATAYVRGGAAAISVLTEPRFFLGSLEHLSAVRAAVDVPVLRKDFVIDPYQVYEARAASADAVLLICALLDDDTLAALLALTRQLGMEALVEAHNAEETRRAVASGAPVIGVNSRDLRTFAVNTDVVRTLRPLVPADRVFIAESGIVDTLGAARARAWGVDAILVGEALMKSADPAARACELATAPGGATAALFSGSSQPFVKICGLANPGHAGLVRELGADAFGLVFAPQAPSHRRLSLEQARELVRAVTRAAPAGGQAVGASGGRPTGSGPTAFRAVGVFVNEPAETIASIAESVGLDAVQLSGDEMPEACAEVTERTGLPVLKALRLHADADLDTLDAFALAGATILLDAHVPGTYGGSGQTGDWDLARRAAERWPIILSGGLTPENVARAIATVHPRGVDVSSGVETHKAKDPVKIAAFIKAAKTATGSEARSDA